MQKIVCNNFVNKQQMTITRMSCNKMIGFKQNILSTIRYI